MLIQSATTLLIFSWLAGCSADNLQPKNKKEADKQEAARTATEDPEDAEADQPVPVSGSYLTCVSLEKSETYHVETDSSVFGCDITNETGERITIVPEKTTMKLVLGSGEVITPALATAKIVDAPFQFYFSISKITAELIAMIGLTTETTEGNPLVLEQNFILKHINDPEYIAENYTTGILYDTFGQTQNNLAPVSQPLATFTPEMKHLLFATQKVYSANVGVAGADKICSEAGKQVAPDRTWIAILSTSTINARDRFAVAGPVYNVMGEKLAGDSKEFWGGKLLSTPKFTEFGQDLSNYIIKLLKYKMSRTWTGSKTDGTYNAAKGTCLDWTVDAFEIGAGIGKAESSDREWIDKDEDVPCNHLGRFFCFSK